MIRGLIVGNSHTAMLITAWREQVSYSKDIEIDFFAKSSLKKSEFQFDGKILHAASPSFQNFLDLNDQKASVDLNDYDFIVVVACSLGIYSILSVLENACVWGWNHGLVRNMNPKVELISGACFQTAARDAINSTVGAHLITKIMAQVDVPTYLVPQPLPREDVLNDKRRANLFDKEQVNFNKQNIFEAFKKCLCALASDRVNTTVIFQTPETIINGIYTRPEFSIGSRRLFDLKLKHGKKDVDHANQDYGAITLNEILSSLKSKRVLL